MDAKERARRFQLARTSLNQNGEEGKMLVYKRTGVPSSALVAYENPESSRALNVEYTQKLAEHYGVNAAWLLGQSESWSLEKDLRQVCDMTGLSPEAVQALQELTGDGERRLFVNRFLASEEFSRMVYSMTGMKRLNSFEHSDSVDYADAFRGYAGGDDLGFSEEDYIDMRIWKAGRGLENVMRMYTEE